MDTTTHNHQSCEVPSYKKDSFCNQHGGRWDKGHGLQIALARSARAILFVFEVEIMLLPILTVKGVANFEKLTFFFRFKA